MPVALIRKIEIRNFECFREKHSFDFDDATFFIGINNSGKSSIFRAICTFFGNLDFNSEHLNRTEFRSKKKNSNQCEISITFDLQLIKNKALKQRLLNKNNKHPYLDILVQIVSRGESPEKTYLVFGQKIPEVDLSLTEPDIVQLLHSIHINYIHPQQGTELLEKAQEKLRRRLLDNWGRSSSVSNEYKKIESDWATYRLKANEYLSDLLTDRVKRFWGEGKVTIELPKSLTEVIKISGISFQTDPSSPEIPLTSQGTGVQQSLLYYASYVLDSDRTLRRNAEYHPVWLLEEPESFLHADMIIKLGKDLTSKEWLNNNIQLLTTTHSGLLLASSINPHGHILWNLISKYELKRKYVPKDIDDTSIRDIGRLMGDPNFDVYFYSNYSKVFIEDTAEPLIQSLKTGGIDAKGLGGIGEIRRYLQALSIVITKNIGTSINAKFIIDGDKGKKTVNEFLIDTNMIKEINGFKKYQLQNNIVIIVLPDGESAENLFDEYSSFITSQAHRICDDNLILKETCPSELANVVSHLRKQYVKTAIPTWNKVESELMRDDDCKRLFWNEVKIHKYQISASKLSTITNLLEPS
jgi:predicted ATPase